MAGTAGIKSIDSASIHKITSGQVVIDLQTAVKELVENSLDAGATNIEVKFKQYGVKSIEVLDNGSGIAEDDHASIGLKHHTSKLSSFTDLTSVMTFGFRGEAISSLCALCESVSVTTAVRPPMGTVLELGHTGKVVKKRKAARQRGTTVVLNNLFKFLPVRRKEFERNAKREFGKALSLLTAYALVPCCSGNGVSLMVSNQVEKGGKSVQIRTQKVTALRDAVASLWGPKAMDNASEFELRFEVRRETKHLKRAKDPEDSSLNDPISITVRGIISKFAFGCGRASTDRQFFYVNGRPCNLTKIQKAFNEAYRSFNTNQSPFVVADFMIPTDTCDVNVSPDKRTIFLHGETELITGLKTALESHFSPTRSTYNVNAGSQAPYRPTLPPTQRPEGRTGASSLGQSAPQPLFLPDVPDTEVSNAPPPSVTVDTTTISWGRPDNLLKRKLGDEDVPTPKRSKPDLEPSSEIGENVGMDSHARGVETRHEETQDDLCDADMLPPPDVPVGSERLSPHSADGLDQMALDKAEMEESVEAIGIPDIEEDTPPPASESIRASDDVQSSPVSRRRGHMQHTAPQVSNDHRPKTIRTVPQSQADIRKYLSGFARTGSQLTQLSFTDEDPSESQDEEDQILASDGMEPVERSMSADNEEQVLDPNGQREESETCVFEHTDDCHGRPVNIEDDSSSVDLSIFEVGATISSTAPITHPEIIKVKSSTEEVNVRFDFSQIASKWKNLLARISEAATSHTESSGNLHAQAGMQSDNYAAAEALSRVINKGDFGTMDVLGQFNLGFIVTRRRTSTGGEDLFIVDQHAADEKYNFETLQQTTVIRSQRLFHPEVLELTAADELVAIENIEILQKNGFEVDTSEHSSSEEHRGRLKLVAKPISKDTVFGPKDLEEIISLLHDKPAGQMVRCSKARAMFAMRACRKSVMVGMPLTKAQMTTVVRHMGTIDQPWNCPHGRPTMRHLHDVSAAPQTPKRLIDWATFV